MAESGRVLEYQRARSPNSRVRNCAWILLLVLGGVPATAGAIIAVWSLLWLFRDGDSRIIGAGTLLAVFPLLFGGIEIKCAFDVRKRLASGAGGGMALIVLQGVLALTLLLTLVSAKAGFIAISSCSSVLLVIVVQAVLLFLVHKEDQALEDAARAFDGRIGFGTTEDTENTEKDI